jgi:hypothetical protein
VAQRIEEVRARPRQRLGGPRRAANIESASIAWTSYSPVKVPAGRPGQVAPPSAVLSSVPKSPAA